MAGRHMRPMLKGGVMEAEGRSGKMHGGASEKRLVSAWVSDMGLRRINLTT